MIKGAAIRRTTRRTACWRGETGGGRRMGPIGSLVLDSTNSAIASARREKAELSMESESLRERVVGETSLIWGRELTPNLEKED